MRRMASSSAMDEDHGAFSRSASVTTGRAPDFSEKIVRRNGIDPGQFQIRIARIRRCWPQWVMRSASRRGRLMPLADGTPACDRFEFEIDTAARGGLGAGRHVQQIVHQKIRTGPTASAAHSRPCVQARTASWCGAAPKRSVTQRWRWATLLNEWSAARS